ncbi:MULTISPECIES: response regulator transcription factor [Burkholderia]|uniref:LuxR family transcriptional regulator n=1 Tax=Burkholderia cenocepacia TaxID=95486 RepID=A0A071MFS5_9BURK|nr:MULTISPECIES: response regulator [Burkholderia]AOJ28632.1 LuxR family transcriptional regulator [Burkholderia seminalis]KVF52663.1 LuxR family transcriptional regulator [Burkholderia seminalis]MBN3738831.1 response regulator transcription factor [Burkholderia sp. Tr-20355]MCA8040356.1 response regulator [Burkholderia seminalis]MCA8302090.1 response regulator [Burkholderia seminalis]
MDAPTQLPLVYVVDDDEDMRTSLSWLLASVKIQTRCFQGPVEFLEQFDPGVPGCLVLDVRMPGVSGFDLQAELNRRGVSLPIIFVSGHGDIPMSVRALQNGAIDFVEKPYNSQQMLDRIQNAMKIASETHRANQHLQALIQRIRALTPREQEVLNGVIEGKASKLIARELGISAKTVDVYRASIKEKLGATSFASLLKDVIEARHAMAAPHPRG